MPEIKPITIDDILSELRELGVSSSSKNPEAKTLEMLCKEWGMGVSKVRKILKQLRDSGYLTSTRVNSTTIDNRLFPVPAYIIKMPTKGKNVSRKRK